jgi:hypothetical protein
MLTHSRQLIASVIVPLCFLLVPGDAVAQTGVPKPLSTEREQPVAAPVSPLRLALDRSSLDVRALTGRHANSGNPHQLDTRLG